MMKSRSLFCLLFVSLSFVEWSAATDIVTLSGKQYFDVRDVQIRDGKLTFSTETEIVKVPLSDVPQSLKDRYLPKATPATPPKAAQTENLTGQTEVPAFEVVPGAPSVPTATNPHDLVVNTANRYLAQMAADLQAAEASGEATYTATDAFSLAQLEEAEKDALTNGRPVAFFLLDETLLDMPCRASEASPRGALAHFVKTFSRSVTPVFVFPKSDLAKLPGVLTTAMAKPVPVSAPRVIFTNADLSEILADLSLTTEKMTFAQRNEAIYPTVGMIKRWYVRVANSVP